MTTSIRNLLKRGLAAGFSISQHFGFDVLPRHFYSEIPDFRVLRKTTSWRKEYPMTGVNGADTRGQLAWLKEVLRPELVRKAEEGKVYEKACREQGEPGYGDLDAEGLYCFIRHFQPRRIIQAGCGVTTHICLKAASDAGYRPIVVCVEPFPSAYLRRLADPGQITLRAAKIQDVEREIVDDLEAGDLFFVDSSHTLGPAGEASRIVLEFLPRLRPGVMIHLHDITFPYDYSPKIFEGLEWSMFFHHESILLLAFLTMNPDFAILASLYMLHHKQSEGLRQLLPNYKPAVQQDGLALSQGHGPTSIYLKRVRQSAVSISTQG
jgi:hypothetical protein